MTLASVPTPEQLAEWIELGDVAAVSAALAAHPSLVSLRTADGDTPLHIACWQKRRHRSREASRQRLHRDDAAALTDIDPLLYVLRRNQSPPQVAETRKIQAKSSVGSSVVRVSSRSRFARE